jgi:hypothetical protein
MIALMIGLLLEVLLGFMPSSLQLDADNQLRARGECLDQGF